MHVHVSFKIHYRNNLIDKKDSYLISCPPSWDDRNYSYGHQLYPSEYLNNLPFFRVIVKQETKRNETKPKKSSINKKNETNINKTIYFT